jgi:putative copper export protein
MSVDIVSVIVKAIGYMALLQAVGVTLFLALFESVLDRSVAVVRKVGVASALASVCAVLCFHLLEAARMTGEYAAVADGLLQSRVLSSALGATTALRVLGALLMGLGLLWASRTNLLLSIVGATLAATSFLLVGHTVTHSPRWALLPLLEFHVLVVAFWFGSIMPLALIARREPAAIAHRVVAQFSGVAALLVPAMAVAGLGLAFILTDGRYSLAEPYSASLTAKVALLLLALILAALNRWRFGPALQAGSVQAVRSFSLSLALEYVLLVTIVVVTATLTNLFSP